MKENLIEDIKEKSAQISEVFISKSNKKLGNPLEHNPFNDYGGIDFKENILVLGLNPSSTDTDKKGKQNDNFLHYVPDKGLSKPEMKALKGFRKEGYVYTKYFKKPYELFWEYGYQPIWTNQSYRQSIFKNKNLNEDEIALISKFQDTSKYTIFSDLVFYKETDSKKVASTIREKSDLCKLIFELFELQIEFFQPKLVLVNNAFASTILTEYLVGVLNKEKKIYTKTNYRNTKIIFSGILSSSGAIDRFSFERLKNEIADELSK
jgi:hypothetical protein